MVKGLPHTYVQLYWWSISQPTTAGWMATIAGSKVLGVHCTVSLWRYVMPQFGPTRQSNQQICCNSNEQLRAGGQYSSRVMVITSTQNPGLERTYFSNSQSGRSAAARSAGVGTCSLALNLSTHDKAGRWVVWNLNSSLQPTRLLCHWLQSHHILPSTSHLCQPELST